MQIDELHLAILNELQQDARLSQAEIGRRVGLTAPAVSERIRRMEESGLIQGYAVRIDHKQLNYAEKVLIGVKMIRGNKDAFVQQARKTEGVTDVIRTTGEYCFFVSLIVRSVEALDEALRTFEEFGATMTFSVLSQPVAGQPIRLLPTPVKR